MRIPSQLVTTAVTNQEGRNPSSDTQVIILAEAALPCLAWKTLLEQQPGLLVWDTAVNLDDIQSLPAVSSQTAILLDLTEPLPQVAQLTKTVPNYGLLSLVNNYDLNLIVTLLQAGASGVLSRDDTVPELVLALVAVGRGEIVLPQSLAARALAAMARGEVYGQRNIEALTAREREVLVLLAQGLTNKGIAQSLFLSVRTIEAHLRNIYGKLHVTSRTEAALWAVQHGVEP